MVSGRISVVAIMLFGLTGLASADTPPAIWSPCTSVNVADIWGMRHWEAFNYGIYALSGREVLAGGSDKGSVVFTIDFPWTGWLTTGGTIGASYLEADVTLGSPIPLLSGLFSALRLHTGGTFESQNVLDAGLVVGMTMRPFGDKLAKLPVVVYLGGRRGQISYDDGGRQWSGGFWSGLLGAEIWIQRLGLQVSTERLEARKPGPALWKHEGQSGSYTLVTCSLKFIY